MDIIYLNMYFIEQELLKKLDNKKTIIIKFYFIFERGL